MMHNTGMNQQRGRYEAPRNPILERNSRCWLGGNRGLGTGKQKGTRFEFQAKDASLLYNDLTVVDKLAQDVPSYHLRLDRNGS